MSIKLVALDIDGTTLNSQGKVLPSTIEAVKKARSMGIEVVFCSGRSLYEQKPFINLLGMKYIITINGTVIRKANGEILQETLLPSETYSKLSQYSINKKIPFNFVDDNFNIYTPYSDIKPVIYSQAVGSQSIIYVRRPEEMTSNIHIAKACFSGNKKQMDQCEEQIRDKFGGDFYILRCSSDFIELFNPVASKGHGLAEMARILHIRREQIMAIGDERNDIPMFKFAKIGVCMGNGVQQAKENADYITASNDEDGINKAFHKFIF